MNLLAVYTEVGLGTFFKIYLPLIEHAVSAAAPPAAREHPPGGDETILVAEDEDVVRNLGRHADPDRAYEAHAIVGWHRFPPDHATST